MLVTPSAGGDILLWVGMESDCWCFQGTCLGIASQCSSETGIPLYTSLCFSVLTTTRYCLQLFFPLICHSPQLPCAECQSPSQVLSVHSFFLGRKWTIQLPIQPNCCFWPSTHSVLMLFQSPRVFWTPYFLPQPLPLILALLLFLEISVRLDSLHPRIYPGYKGTNSPNSAFLSLKIKYLSLFPKGFVVCGSHVITSPSDGIGHMHTTCINLQVIITMTC